MSVNKPDFIRLGALVFEEDGWGIGNLATAIECHGIWGADRFGRHTFFAPPKPDNSTSGKKPAPRQPQDASHVLDLLALEQERQEKALAEAIAAARLENRMPLMPSIEVNFELMRYGWHADQIPDFAAIAAKQDPRAPSQFPEMPETKGNGKADSTQIRLIGALLHVLAGAEDDTGQRRAHPDWPSPGDPQAFNRLVSYISKTWADYPGMTERTIKDHFRAALQVIDLPPGERPALVKLLRDTN